MACPDHHARRAPLKRHEAMAAVLAVFAEIRGKGTFLEGAKRVTVHNLIV